MAEGEGEANRHKTPQKSWGRDVENVADMDKERKNKTREYCLSSFQPT